MPTARIGPHTARRWPQNASALALGIALLLPAACNVDGPTQAGAGPVMETSTNAAVESLSGCTSCIRDNFTDSDGKPLVDHIPDGGSVPFSWNRSDTYPTTGAQIQNNAVGHNESAGWIYLTSVDAGDSAELEVDVFASPATQHDVGIVLRANPSNQTFYKGYTISWLIYPDGQGSDIAIDRLDSNLLFQSFTTENTSVQIHRFRAEILPSGVINAYVDDALAATVTDPNPLHGGKAGIALFNAGTPSTVRFNSFAAAIPCPPTGDPVLDDATVRQGLQDELSLSRPNPNGSGRAERRGYLYQQADGSYILVPANDPAGTMCGFTFEDLPIPPEIEGATFVGDYHTHPSKHLEVLTGCPRQPPGEVWKANRKANSGGGSDGDWEFADVRGKSHYIIDIDGRVWRLDPNTLPDARKNNPNRWKLSGTGCLERA